MGVAWSVLIAEIDASESSSVDEAECRLLFGDAFDEAMWRSAPKDDAGRVTKRTLLQHLGWPSEVFDGRSGTREEARAVNDAAETAARGTPHFYELSPDAARDARRASYVHSAFREDFEVSDAGDDASATIAFAAWRPRDRRTNTSSPEAPLVKPRASYLLFHGGGWVFGDAKGLNDERLEEMADALRVVVLVPDYRKAPERPFPAALDDCEAAAAWCETRARAYFGLDETAPLLIGGESCSLSDAREIPEHWRRCASEAEGGVADAPLKAATALDVWTSAETEGTERKTKRKRLVSFVCALPSSAAAPPPSETTAT